MDFNSEQVATAVECVIEHLRNGREAVYYSDVFADAGLPAPQEIYGSGEPGEVTRFMKAFHDLCLDLGYPPLDSFVVHKAGRRQGFPGPGYFAVNGWPDPLAENQRVDASAASTQHWQDAKEACRGFLFGPAG